MSLSPRAEALRLMRPGEAIEPPEMPDLEPNSSEALAYIDSFKEEHFVVLAQLMDKLLGHALENRRGDQRPLRRGWQSVADDWHTSLMDAQEMVESSDLYQTTDRFAEVTGSLNTSRHISVTTKLYGGIGTGVLTTFTLLRNLPHIIRYHAGTDEAVEPTAVARHPRSNELVRRLAKVSINHAMAAQAAIAGESQPSSWAGFDKVLEPQHFRLHRYEGAGTSLGYDDFTSLKVPAGYKPHEPLPVTAKPTLARDIPNQQSKTIGCPITLLQGRLAELWNWGIDLVEANELWSEDWPPQAA